MKHDFQLYLLLPHLAATSELQDLSTLPGKISEFFSKVNAYRQAYQSSRREAYLYFKLLVYQTKISEIIRETSYTSTFHGKV